MLSLELTFRSECGLLEEGARAVVFAALDKGAMTLSEVPRRPDGGLSLAGAVGLATRCMAEAPPRPASPSLPPHLKPPPPPSPRARLLSAVSAASNSSNPRDSADCLEDAAASTSSSPLFMASPRSLSPAIEATREDAVPMAAWDGAAFHVIPPAVCLPRRPPGLPGPGFGSAALVFDTSAARAALAARDKAARFIQKWVKRLVAVQIAARRLEVLQATFRGRRLRRRLALIDHHVAAIHLQRLWRGYRGRLRAVDRRVHVDLLAMEAEQRLAEAAQEQARAAAMDILRAAAQSRGEARARAASLELKRQQALAVAASAIKGAWQRRKVRDGIMEAAEFHRAERNRWLERRRLAAAAIVARAREHLRRRQAEMLLRLEAIVIRLQRRQRARISRRHALFERNAALRAKFRMLSDENLSTVFKFIDTSGDTEVSVSEWTAAIRRAAILTAELTQSPFRQMRLFGMIDADGSGSVDFEEFRTALQREKPKEFVDWMEQLLTKKHQEATAKAVNPVAKRNFEARLKLFLQSLDPTDSGTITIQAFMSTLRRGPPSAPLSVDVAVQTELFGRLAKKPHATEMNVDVMEARVLAVQDMDLGAWMESVFPLRMLLGVRRASRLRSTAATVGKFAASLNRHRQSLLQVFEEEEEGKGDE